MDDRRPRIAFGPRPRGSYPFVGAAALGVFFVTGNVAFAQRAATLPKEDGGVLQWVVAAGIVFVICVTAFLNPKRSHLN